jgi:hypothetical protein
MNESPLGSGAVCGTTFPLNREMTARALGFDGPSRNSLDATADRDFLLLGIKFHPQSVAQPFEVLGPGKPGRETGGFIRPDITEQNRHQFTEERIRHRGRSVSGLQPGSEPELRQSELRHFSSTEMHRFNVA